MKQKDRAIVLGGGGPVGEAWESGVIAGLMENGVELSRADLIVGTSAGAIVGARLAMRMLPADLLKATLEFPDHPASNQSPRAKPPDMSFMIAKFEEMDAAPHRPAEPARAVIGEWAGKTRPVTSEAEFVASYQRRFPEKAWPSPTFECASVAVADGTLRMWNASSGVATALAVASSCALPGFFAPVTIDGHGYMDGGVRSATNADLARGYKPVLVIAPTSGQSNPIAKHGDLPNEVKILRESGSYVELIVPDDASLKVFGGMLGDEARRAPAGNAGLNQGRSKAAEIAKAWND
jgi:NTE family protein